jgi:hypothetical protein
LQEGDERKRTLMSVLEMGQATRAEMEQRRGLRLQEDTLERNTVSTDGSTGTCGVHGLWYPRRFQKKAGARSTQAGAGIDQYTGTWAFGLRQRVDLDGVAAASLFRKRMRQGGLWVAALLVGGQFPAVADAASIWKYTGQSGQAICALLQATLGVRATGAIPDECRDVRLFGEAVEVSGGL